MGDRWDDQRWTVGSDTPWQAGLRWLQCWWRSEHLDLPPGPFTASAPDDLVGSMLPVDAPPTANFLSPEAAEAAERRLATVGGGLIGEDRLRRNLLSSQPMCFNLFGHLQRDPDALRPWVSHATRHPCVERVTRIELEWAPSAPRLGGGSAFDAFVEYETTDGQRGFIGVECKYHEHLPRTDVKRIRDIYRTHTLDSPAWTDDAPSRLDRLGLRQFWLNTLLAETVAEDAGYDHWTVAIVACAHDRSARAACDQVRAELVDPTHLTWHPWETILSTIEDQAPWREQFWTRYLDFSPVAHFLDSSDPRRSTVTVAMAAMHAERVLGSGSVLERVENEDRLTPELTTRLAAIVDELKTLRIDAGRTERRPD